MRHLIWIIFFLSFTAVAQKLPFNASTQYTEKGISFRGLCVLDAQNVWVSGSNGRVLRTTDAGKTWVNVSPQGFEKYDFRDIHAFDSQTAVMINAGSPTFILRTTDAGKTWQQIYQNTHEKAFLDDIAFEGDKGIVFGDPDSTGKFLTLLSEDAGKTWQTQYDFFPIPEGQEAGFAASGSILQYQNGAVWLATGGGAKSRLFYASQAGKGWEIQHTPIQAGKEAQGIFSLAIGAGKVWVAVGGDYTQSENPAKTAIYTLNAGKTWAISTLPPAGYRSGVAHLKGKTFVCVGTSGADYTKDAGKTWKPLNKLNANAIRFAKKADVGWVVGNDGLIYQLF